MAIPIHWYTLKFQGKLNLPHSEIENIMVQLTLLLEHIKNKIKNLHWTGHSGADKLDAAVNSGKCFMWSGSLLRKQVCLARILSAAPLGFVFSLSQLLKRIVITQEQQCRLKSSFDVKKSTQRLYTVFLTALSCLGSPSSFSPSGHV